MELKKFQEIDEIFENRKIEMSKRHHDFIELAEDGIAINFSLMRSIELELIEEVKKSGKKLNGYRAIKYLLLRKANNYLNSALFLARNGHVDASYSCLRSVIEHIWDIYFLEVGDNEKRELYYKNQIGNITKKEKDSMRSFRPAFMREQLYDEKRRSKMSELYDMLCKSTHTSIMGLAQQEEFGTQVSDDLAKFIPMMAAALLVVGIEIVPNDIDEEKIELLKHYSQKVGASLGFLPDLLPNNIEIAKKIRITHN